VDVNVPEDWRKQAFTPTTTLEPPRGSFLPGCECNRDVSPTTLSPSYNRLVRRSLKAVGTVIFAFLLLIVVAVAYSTTHGYATWWLRVFNGNVAVDGVRSGYLHRNSAHSAVIITRTDLSPAQSYLVGLSDRRWLIYCGEWHAPRFLAFPIGDVNPPCSGFRNSSDMQTADNPVSSTLKTGPRFVEFQTVQGKKVTASW
jgi:hypothetical protein